MKIFTQHPASIGETYGQHFAHASGFGVAMLSGGFACLVHAVFPWLCERTGSDTIRRLYRSMVTNRADIAKLDELESHFDWVI
ncbi:DUF6356 family protein [uncultured Erythrobacter sp.]|uniref:DUF6356 family protein n=1 Tax=uncultured Erythrobacter sp. TaxID=263913 RepID=UPI0026199F6D|nr:DUF6356 family protein [uncultured Erythrobacter sp.]